MKKKRSWLSRLLLTALIAGLLGTVVFAGSPRSYFSCTFNGQAKYFTSNGTKTDADSSTGSYANVRLTSGVLNDRYLTFWVLNESGYQATGSVNLYSLNTVGSMYYLSGQLYNGPKTLIISSSGGVDGCAGYWNP